MSSIHTVAGSQIFGSKVHILFSCHVVSHWVLELVIAGSGDQKASL